MAAEMVPPLPRRDLGKPPEKYRYTVTWNDGTTTSFPADSCTRDGDDWVFRLGAREVERIPRVEVAHFTSA